MDHNEKNQAVDGVEEAEVPVSYTHLDVYKRQPDTQSDRREMVAEDLVAYSAGR